MSQTPMNTVLSGLRRHVTHTKTAHCTCSPRRPRQCCHRPVCPSSYAPPHASAAPPRASSARSRPPSTDPPPAPHAREGAARPTPRARRDVRSASALQLYTTGASSTGWATSTTAQSTTVDPAEVEAMQCLEEGTQKLEEGDVQAAKVGIVHMSRPLLPQINCLPVGPLSTQCGHQAQRELLV